VTSSQIQSVSVAQVMSTTEMKGAPPPPSAQSNASIMQACPQSCSYCTICIMPTTSSSPALRGKSQSIGALTAKLPLPHYLHHAYYKQQSSTARQNPIHCGTYGKVPLTIVCQALCAKRALRFEDEVVVLALRPTRYTMTG